MAGIENKSNNFLVRSNDALRQERKDLFARQRESAKKEMRAFGEAIDYFLMHPSVSTIHQHFSKRRAMSKENMRYAPQFWDCTVSYNKTRLPHNRNCINATFGYNGKLGRRKSLPASKTKLCAFLYSNPYCTTRNEFYKILSQYWRIDALGMVLGNHASTHPRFAPNWREDIDIIYRPYKFAVCFENSASSYYITEKVMYALRAGCVPIYWGATKITDYINPDCFINAYDFESLESLAQYVLRVESDAALYQNYATARPLAKQQKQNRRAEIRNEKLDDNYRHEGAHHQRSLPVAQKILLNRETLSRLGGQALQLGLAEYYYSGLVDKKQRYARGSWPFL